MRYTEEDMLSFASYFGYEPASEKDLEEWGASTNLKEIRDKVIAFEKSISEWDEKEWKNELVFKISQLKTKEDVKKYYLIDRDWSSNNDLIISLCDLLISL